MDQSNAYTPRSGLISISFDYPFQLRCPPTQYPIILDTKEMGFVNIEHKEGLVIYDKGSITDDSSDQMKVIRGKATDGSVRFRPENSSLVHVDMDENGRAIYPKYFTKVDVIFPIEDLSVNIAAPDNAEYIENFKRKFFERFMFAYMYGIGDFSIELSEKNLWPTQKRVGCYEFSEEDKASLKMDGSTKNFFTRFSNLKNQFKSYMGYEKTNGFVSADIATPDRSNIKKQNCYEEDFQKMFLNLLAPNRIEPHLPFLYSAIRRSHMDGEHFLAIVDLATTVEVAFSYFHAMYVLLFDFPDYKSTDEKVVSSNMQKVLDEFNKMKMYSTKVTEKSRIKTLEAYKTKFEEVLGNKIPEKFSDSSDCIDWIEKAWKLRHKIVHEGEQSVSKERVSEALRLAQAVIHQLGFDQASFKRAHDRLREQGDAYSERLDAEV